MKHVSGYYVQGVREETVRKLESWLLERDLDLREKYVQAEIRQGKRSWEIQFRVVSNRKPEAKE